MNPQKNQEEGGNPLLQGIQAEVTPESAPLLDFITRYAPAIAGLVLVFLLVLGGMAVWNWYHKGRQEETRAELDRISTRLKGAERDKALAALAENAPEGTRLFIYMSLGQSAQENGDPVLAAEAYAKAASLDGDGSLGLTAALGSAGSLMMQGQYSQALALLQELEARLPQAQGSATLRQMLAEAAAKAGETRLAIETYEKLGREKATPEAAYFRSRAAALKAGLESGKAPAGQGSAGAGEKQGD